jgi:hypothetical protein
VIGLHGGRVWASSDPGKWAEFAFRLPQPILGNSRIPADPTAVGRLAAANQQSSQSLARVDKLIETLASPPAEPPAPAPK